MKYSEEKIKNVLMLLNNLEVKGIDNATRIVMINQILQNPEKGENDGNE